MKVIITLNHLFQLLRKVMLKFQFNLYIITHCNAFPDRKNIGEFFTHFFQVWFILIAMYTIYNEVLVYFSISSYNRNCCFVE